MNALPAPPTTLHLATPRMDFACRAWGAEDGIPVLLLHGSYGTSRWWERFAAALPEEVYAVAPDLRGCGQSTHSEGGYGVAEQADDVAGLVAALGWDDFHLVAHSSSGAIGMEYALDPRARLGQLATLTLVDSVPVEGVFTPLDTYLVLEQLKTDRALLAQALALLLPGLVEQAQADAESRALFEQLVDDAQAMAPAAFTAVARGLGQWNRFGEARRLTLPTLLVWGERDVVVDRDATTRTLLAIPGASNLELLRGVGHSPMLEAPGRLAERFVDFITQDFAGFDAVRGRV